jgi:hypothetical protein
MCRASCNSHSFERQGCAGASARSITIRPTPAGHFGVPDVGELVRRDIRVQGGHLAGKEVAPHREELLEAP